MRAEITGHRLTSLFRPERVALVGASDRSTFSRNAYENLVSFGFGARTYLVNRRGVLTHGQPTVRSCAEIGDPVDVAFLMVPQAGMLEALDDAAAAGIRNAVVLSAGYAEAGAAGRAAQAELVAHAESLGIVLLGPNHLGFANFVDGAPVCSIPGLPRQAGPVALLSHSGASCSAMVQCATMANVALSYLVTLGNEAMITAGHVLDFLVDDPATRAVAIFMEAVRDHEVFRRAARHAADAGKAIVVLKVGGSELSARSEDAARRMLERAGVPVIPARLACSADEAVKAAAAFGEPVSVKVASPQIAHKTDIGGVRLDVPADSGAVRDAFRAVTAAAERSTALSSKASWSARCAAAVRNCSWAWSVTRGP